MCEYILLHFSTFEDRSKRVNFLAIKKYPFLSATTADIYTFFVTFKFEHVNCCLQELSALTRNITHNFRSFQVVTFNLSDQTEVSCHM